MSLIKSRKPKRSTLQYEDKKQRESQTKKVMIDIAETSTTASLVQLTPSERLMKETEQFLNTRSELKIYEKAGNEVVNLTPKMLRLENEEECFSQLLRKYSNFQIFDRDMSLMSAKSSLMRSRGSRGLGLHMSIDDIMIGIGIDPLQLDEAIEDLNFSSSVPKEIFSHSSLAPDEIFPKPKCRHQRPLIRIILRKTELLLLYEQHGSISIKNTEDGKFAEIDNKEYEYLTVGKGKIRKRSEGESQTYQTLFKSRKVNTDSVHTKNVASFMAHYEMFDTYKGLGDIKYGSYEDKPKKLLILQNKTINEQLTLIGQLPSFQWATAVIGRLLAGNAFQKSQRRFRNMTKVSRRVNKINYKYSIKTLFTIEPTSKDFERRAVADMSFCYKNSDIFAVAFGIFSYQAAKLSSSGEVCIWSIKNPCNPEHIFNYSVPVVSAQFSPFICTLLAIGLFDGTVEVRDISQFNQSPVATSKRSSTPGIDPVLAIKWLKQSTANDTEIIEAFLALSQNGSVTVFHITNSPFLSTFQLMSLRRLESLPEGLPGITASTALVKHSKPFPQSLNLIKHPTKLDIYYILTDEGCVFQCSTNSQHHYLQALQTHDGSVNHMDFSPWSPKLFLTCGNDWCIRIWMDGILEPLVTLKNLHQPYNWAAWNRTHATILTAINPTQCEIWDIKRSILNPVSSTKLNTSNNTLGIFTLDGCSILIGKERGQVYVNAFDEMPFPPHYQYDALEEALEAAVRNYTDLLAEFKSIGYFGYPNKGCVHSY